MKDFKGQDTCRGQIFGEKRKASFVGNGKRTALYVGQNPLFEQAKKTSLRGEERL